MWTLTLRRRAFRTAVDSQSYAPANGLSIDLPVGKGRTVTIDMALYREQGWTATGG